jgi:hypothetical protein
MNPDLDKHCKVCSIDYEGTECPSCNPKVLYHVEIGVDMGTDDFQFSDCLCGCADFWDLKEAKEHAREENAQGTVMRVFDDECTEVWATD